MVVGDMYGGIAGDNYNGTIKDCIYLGEQVGGNMSVGAILGRNYDGTVNNCYFATEGLKGIDNEKNVTTDNGKGSAVGLSVKNAKETNVGLARTIINQILRSITQKMQASSHAEVCIQTSLVILIATLCIVE